jgi:hypothetical protein
MDLLVALLVAAFLIGGMAMWNRWAVRQRGLKRLRGSALVRVERGIDLSILVQGARHYAGLNPNKRNRTRGDIAITDRRLIVSSARGVLLDATLGQQRVTAARCTGPGRLVIEGTLPRPDGPPGQFRIETVVADAPGWARALAPWVGGDSPPDLGFS